MSRIRNGSVMSRTGKFLFTAAAVVLFGDWASRAEASLSTVGIATTQLTPTTWKYDLTLGDSSASATPIGTLWYAWIPGQDYLTTSPLSVVTPAGWTNDLVVNGGGVTNGYSIRWVANSAATGLQPGGSLSGFSFTSTDPPSNIFGDSAYYPTTPTSTFFTYNGAPLTGTAVEAVGTAVPEPATMALLLPMLLLKGRRRRVL